MAIIGPQIYNDELILHFPDLKLEPGPANSFLSSDLQNAVEMQGHPVGKSDDEPLIEANDEFIFNIRAKGGGGGNITKAATEPSIYDVYSKKAADYTWRIRVGVSNDADGLRNYTIYDGQIAEDLYENQPRTSALDDRLKFTGIASYFADEATKGASTYFSNGWSYANSIDYVRAYYDDDTYEDFTYENGIVVDGQDFEVRFNEDKTCIGWYLKFKEDFELNGVTQDATTVRVFTQFKEPAQSYYVAGDGSNNTVTNTGSIIGEDNGNIVSGSFSASYYLLDGAQDLNIAKQIYHNNGPTYFKNQPGDGQDPGTVSPMVGLTLTGNLLEDFDGDDLRIIDLLSEGFHYNPENQKSNLTYGFTSGIDRNQTARYYLADEYCCQDGNTWKGDPNAAVEEIKNYNGTGRTAGIIHLDAKKVREQLANGIINQRVGSGSNAKNAVFIQFFIKIDEDAMPGMFDNYVYAALGNLVYTGTGLQGQNNGFDVDTYDLNNNGLVDEKLPFAVPFVVVAAQAMFAEKQIAIDIAGAGNWTKDGFDRNLGEEFYYKLRITNYSAVERERLIIYDVLPKYGDLDIHGQTARNSEFTVQLTGSVTTINSVRGGQTTNVVDDYTVYYTTSAQVYDANYEMMDAIDDAALGWAEASNVTDWSKVTAIKAIAKEGTTLAGGRVSANSGGQEIVSNYTELDVIMPAKVPDVLSAAMPNYADVAAANTTGDFKAWNGFGYFVWDDSLNGGAGGQSSGRASRYVWVNLNVPTGDLLVKKTVAGNAADATKDFAFRVTLSDTSINGEYGGMTLRTASRPLCSRVVKRKRQKACRQALLIP